MGVVVNPMNVVQLGDWLSGVSEFQTIQGAVDALGLTGTEGAGLGGTAFRVISGGAPASTVGPAVSPGNFTEIIDFVRAAELQAGGAEVGTSGIGVVETPTGIKPVGLLGVDLGVVGAAVAPILGVTLGANLYQENPELWTKISQRLLPFCYPGTTEIPTWAEIANNAWQALLPKSIVDALKALFDEEGIGEPEGAGDRKYGDYYGYSSGSATCTSRASYPAGWSDRLIVSGTAPVVVIARGTVPEIFSSGIFSAIYQTIQPNGEVYKSTNFSVSSGYGGYYCTGSSHFYSTPVSGANNVPRDTYIDISSIIGDIRDGGSPTPGGYPPGTSKWGGTTYPTPPSGSPIIRGIDYPQEVPTPRTEPSVPVSFPIEVPEPSTDPEVRPEEWPEELPAPIPAPSQDPEEQPDPAVVTEPEAQIEPWIMPEPVPQQEPVPVPVPAPERDPSQPTPPEKEIPPGSLVDLIPPFEVPQGTTPWPSLPTTPMAYDSVNAGLITVYHPTPQQLYAFSRWLWVTLSEATIQTVWNNPFDGVITLFELYCTPTDDGERTIHSGFLDSGVNSATISRYTELNCGTITIPEFYGNYFDYSPYSKAHVYLPFIGIQELNVDDIVGHAVNITYRIDEYNGACIAMITVVKSTEVAGQDVDYMCTMYQFTGNCSVDLPISGGNQSQIKAGLLMADATRQAAAISAGAQLIGGLGSLLTGSIGGLIGGATGAVSTLANAQVSALGHMLSGKSTVQKSGTFGSSHGALGIKNPFIVVTRPKQIVVPNYEELYGYPAHKLVVIGSCTGFIRCREVQVVSATATDDEKKLIEEMLKTGVYVTE